MRRYRGSADAVRRNLPVVLEPYRGTAVPDDLLILSGQALYRMVRRPPRPAAQQGPSLASAAAESVSRSDAGSLTQHPASRPHHAVSGSCMRALARRGRPRMQARCGSARSGERAPRAQDYGQLIRTHREADADITICTNSVGWEMAPRRGLARVNPDTGARPPRGGRRAPGAGCWAQGAGLRARASLHASTGLNAATDGSVLGLRGVT